MDFFIDTCDQNLYITTKRNGSTLLSEISSVSSRLRSVDLQEAIGLLNKNTKIYAPIRDPITRFKSGLSVNLYNRTSNQFNIIDDTAVNLYKQMLIYFDNSIVETGKLISIYPSRPYHLYDPHCDHWLGTLLLFSGLGFNLEPVPMNKLSEHLLQRFPEGSDYIKKRERTDSFNKTKPDYEKLYETYKEIFIDKTLSDTMTFDQWMHVELEIFDLLMSYTDKELNEQSFLLLNSILDRKVYYNDLYSPNTHTMFIILQELSQKNLTTEKLDNFLAHYQTIRDRSYKVYNMDI